MQPAIVTVTMVSNDRASKAVVTVKGGEGTWTKGKHHRCLLLRLLDI